MSPRAKLRVALAALALVAAAAPARAQSAAPSPAVVVPVAPAEAAPPASPAVPAPRLSPPAPARTLVAVPAKPPRVPLAKRWWFWAGLGTAAVAVVLAAIFLGPRDPYNGNANPGTVFF